MTYNRILALVEQGNILISEHGYDEMVQDDISIKDIITSLHSSKLIEDYPEYPKGPCILLLQYDSKNKPIHTVWGIPKGKTSPAVLVTAYRPNPNRWDVEFIRRKK
jgi:hypothetical protein